MLVTRIKEISEISYNGKPYRTMDVEARDCEEGAPYTESFGSDTLADAILDESDTPRDRDAEFIDNSLYAYLPDEVFSMSNLKIKAYIERNID